MRVRVTFVDVFVGSESELLLQLQQMQSLPVGLSACGQRQQSGDEMMHVQVELPFAGTWRVTAGFGDCMLQHAGDVVAADAAAALEGMRRSEVAAGKLPWSVVEALQPTQAAAGMDGGKVVQRQRLQLPEAFDSDDDKPMAPAIHPDPPNGSPARVGAGAGQATDIEHVLCVKGAGVTNQGVGSGACMSYTHSGPAPLLFALPLPLPLLPCAAAHAPAQDRPCQSPSCSRVLLVS